MYLKKRYLATAVLMLSPWLFAMTQIYAEEANVNLETDLVVGNVGKVEEAVVVEFIAEEDNKETAVDSSDVVAEKEIPNPVTKPEEEHATEVNSDTEHSSPKVEEPPLVVDEVVAKNGIVEEAGNWYYYEDDIRQFDVMIALDGKRYYFEPEQYRGVMSRNKWAYSPNVQSWFYSDQDGDISTELTPLGYAIKGQAQYDTLASVHGFKYYFEPERYRGVMSRNKWAYSPTLQTWFHSDSVGLLDRELNSNGYKINNVSQYDSLVNINNDKYYFEPEQYRGVMARNKWAYSPALQTWFHSRQDGITHTEVAPHGYKINGILQYDTVAAIHVFKYYFEPQLYKGVMSRNKWAYSPSQQSWFYSKVNGEIKQEITPRGYWVDNAQQYDTVAQVHGYKYYFEPKQYNGVMSRNKWAYSPNAKAWYHSINVGYLDIEIAPGGYVVGGKKQYDAIAEVMGNFFYFEPERYHGWMSRGKWAYSPRTQLWYRTNNEGHINLVDKVGPVLPRTVKLDDGSMKVFTHYNWQRLESGCYLRATANGMNAIGFDVTPATIWNALPKTNDPRTGILGNPVVSNNWDLGGAYSAAYPMALMPIIQQYSQHSEDITGASLEDIKRELANGNTVQVFYAWVKPNVRLNSGNGVFYASKDYHSVLLTGYTDHGFYHLESWGAIHNEYLANSKLSWQYNLMGKMAIAFRKTKPTLTATPVQN